MAYYNCICPDLAQFSKVFVQIGRTKAKQAHDQWAPNRGALTIPMILIVLCQG